MLAMGKAKQKVSGRWLKWEQLCTHQRLLMTNLADAITAQGQAWKDGQMKYYQGQLDELMEHEPEKFK